MTQREQINPSILVWARESAGLDLKDAAKHLSLGDSQTETAEQKLLDLEAGTRLPTRPQLVRIAKTYRRPLLTFYLETPPRKGPRGEDFRAAKAEVSPRENALLDALLRDIKARQEMVRGILDDIDEATQKKIVKSISIADGAENIAKRITEALGIPSNRRNWGNTPDEFFKRLRAAAEKLGVFVLLVGDLGSYQSALSEEVFRGFALADPVAPFVVINDHDARTARSFTLIHELVHIYLGQSGVSGTPESVKSNSAHGRIEQFCNEVAGLVLLPKDFASVKPRELASVTQESASSYIEKTASHWLVSEPLVAFRLRNLGWLSESQYRSLQASYAARWASSKAKVKAANKMKEGGPSYYTLRLSRLGDALVDIVRRTVRESRLSHTKAGKVLGVNPSSVEPLLRKYERHPASIAQEAGR